MPAKSQAQAGFLGRIAGGEVDHKSISREKAREMLRGTKVKKLPRRSGQPDYTPPRRSDKPKVEPGGGKYRGKAVRKQRLKDIREQASGKPVQRPTPRPAGADKLPNILKKRKNQIAGLIAKFGGGKKK